MKVKLKDIAEHLNISVSTVSRALNNKDRVSKETCQKVRAAAKELGYVPNEVARSLKQQYMKAIGVVITDIESDFYSRLISGVEEVAYSHGYNVLVCSSNGSLERERRNINLLLGMNIAGLIISTVFDKIPEGIQQRLQNIPVVFADNRPENCNGCEFITVDNYGLSKMLVNKLIDSNHERIAILEGSLAESSHMERLRGFESALTEAGRKLDPALRGASWSNSASGYEATKVLLENKKVDALFAANSYLAYGAVRAIREADLRIPEDVSVVCFDAVDQTGLAQLKLTSVVQPAMEMGRLASQLLIYAQNEQKPKSTVHVMEGKYVHGNTIRE